MTTGIAMRLKSLLWNSLAFIAAFAAMVVTGTLLEEVSLGYIAVVTGGTLDVQMVLRALYIIATYLLFFGAPACLAFTLLQRWYCTATAKRAMMTGAIILNAYLWLAYAVTGTAQGAPTTAIGQAIYVVRALLIGIPGIAVEYIWPFSWPYAWLISSAVIAVVGAVGGWVLWLFHRPSKEPTDDVSVSQ